MNNNARLLGYNSPKFVLHRLRTTEFLFRRDDGLMHYVLVCCYGFRLCGPLSFHDVIYADQPRVYMIHSVWPISSASVTVNVYTIRNDFFRGFCESYTFSTFPISREPSVVAWRIPVFLLQLGGGSKWFTTFNTCRLVLLY